MKATLEFNLPEEAQEHLRTIHAGEAWIALSDIREMIRRHKKYDDGDADTVIQNIGMVVFDAEQLLGE